MTQKTTVIIHVPVSITADDPDTLRDVVRELRSVGHKYSVDPGHGSFKIITNGVKLRDVKERFEKLHTRKGDLQSDDPWPFRSPKSEHPRAKTAASKKKPQRSGRKQQ